MKYKASKPTIQPEQAVQILQDILEYFQEKVNKLKKNAHKEDFNPTLELDKMSNKLTDIRSKYNIRTKKQKITVISFMGLDDTSVDKQYAYYRKLFYKRTDKQTIIQSEQDKLAFYSGFTHAVHLLTNFVSTFPTEQQQQALEDINGQLDEYWKKELKRH